MSTAISVRMPINKTQTITEKSTKEAKVNTKSFTTDQALQEVQQFLTTINKSFESEQWSSSFTRVSWAGKWGLHVLNFDSRANQLVYTKHRKGKCFYKKSFTPAKLRLADLVR